MPTVRILVASLCAWLGCACVASVAPPGVLVASDPPGARVYVDGRDSGWVTPAYLDLGHERQRIDLALDGYDGATVVVAPGGERYYLVLWQEAYAYHNTWRCPLWLNWEDGLGPVKMNKRLHPSRIFVPLRVARGQE
jgi:hypothetical protein